MPLPGRSQQRLAGLLGDAYDEGLLSEHTLAHRLGLLFGSRLVDPGRLVGDLVLRPVRGSAVLRALASAGRALRSSAADCWGGGEDEPALVLALEWTGRPRNLIVGRDLGCDVVLAGRDISRRHALLRFRDGRWVVQDLDSTNGTILNGVRVGRCRMQPGDRLVVGRQAIQID
jgi:hypothetical protein